MSRLIRLIEDEKHYSKEDIEIISYGLENLKMKLYFLLGALVIGACLGKMVDVILFLAFFIPMRTVAGGYHCKTRLRCAVWSVALLLLAVAGMSMMEEYVIVNNYLMGMFVLSIYMIWFIAPVGTRNKPLDEYLKTRCHKKICRLILIYIVAFLVTYVLKWELVTSAICVATFLVAIIVGWGYLVNESIPSTDM